jgi:hypothetical protein
VDSGRPVQRLQVAARIPEGRRSACRWPCGIPRAGAPLASALRDSATPERPLRRRCGP